ncbi:MULTISPECIES: DsbA family oxidoreductase [Actinomyces]|uniref:DsbA family oxidoreductase n=1 Tax=Actinomyces TaxID=1654 RepID=UPI00096A5964|nr:MULTISPECIES: DsbA family oxidoreductase [Actinomyces]
MHIDVWTDVACPWCYLGIRHLRSALAAFEHAEEVEVVAHAYFLDPELSERSELSEVEYLMEHKGITREQVDQAHERLSSLGSAEGFTFDFDHLVVVPTSNAHRVVAAAREHDLAAGTETGADTTQLRLLEAIDRAHFELGLDIADADVLIGCAQDVGMEAEDVVAALADEQRASEVFSDYQIAVQMGIDSVPTLLVDRTFVVQGAQPVTALANALGTAWEQSHSVGADGTGATPR